MTHDTSALRPQDLTAIRNNPLFQRLPDRALTGLLESGVVRSVPRGTSLFMQDETADRFYVLLEGWVKLYRVTRDGDEAVVAIIAPGETFAEAAMLAHGSFPVSAQTVTDARVLSITSAGFSRCLRDDPQIAFSMLGSLALRLRGLVHQIEQLKIQPTPQRVGSFLLQFCPSGHGAATFELPFDKALVAKRLGMQPETFSRALAKLRMIGVETHGHTVSVADLDALRDYCHADEG